MSDIAELRAAIDALAAELRTGPKLSYTIPEAVKATGIGRTSLYEDIAAGRLRAKKRGSSTIILTERLTEYLAALPDLETKQ